jgi:hypothetical protein
LRGFSFVINPVFGSVYIRHLNILDSAEIDLKSEEFREQARNLPTNEEKEDYLVAENLWSRKKTEELKDLKKFIDGLLVTKTRLILQAQIDAINKELEENRSKLLKLESHRAGLMGITQDTYVLRRTNEYYMFKSLYLDRDLTKPLFSSDDFDELDDTSVINLIELYNHINSRLNHTTLQKIALFPGFLNAFYMCSDNPFYFYGCPASKLSFYQIELFNHGKYFKHILAETKGNLDENLLEDPEKLIEWYNSSQNAQKLLENAKGTGEGGAVSIVGATKEDYARAGIVIDDKPMMDMAAEAKKRGGRLTLKEMIELEQV